MLELTMVDMVVHSLSWRLLAAPSASQPYDVCVRPLLRRAGKAAVSVDTSQIWIGLQRIRPDGTLADAGEALQLAIVAVMQRLVMFANALLKDVRAWATEMADQHGYFVKP
jgi:hypothetical protein